jgi:hypothetical protein
MTEADSDHKRELRDVLGAVETRVRRLTVAVVLMALASFLLVAAVLGELVNYGFRDMPFFAAVGVGAAVVGFAFGWFAGRRA